MHFLHWLYGRATIWIRVSICALRHYTFAATQRVIMEVHVKSFDASWLVAVTEQDSTLIAVIEIGNRDDP